MEVSAATLFMYLILAFIALLLFMLRNKDKIHLPPGPPGWLMIITLLRINFSNHSLQDYVYKLHQKYGSILTIRMGSRPLIMISSHELAHEALVQKGSIFASRAPPQGLIKVFSTNETSINGAPYGPLWRDLRKNLMTQVLNTSSLKSFREGREWGMEVLMESLIASKKEGVVTVIDHVRYGLVCMVSYMCFGVRLEDKAVADIAAFWTQLRHSGVGLPLNDLFPLLNVFYRKQRKRMRELRRRQEELLVPLINRRRRSLAEGKAGRGYIDSLLCLTVEGGNRRLSEDEVVTLCSEFLNSATDTTSAALEWVMARLVMNGDCQAKLYREIVGVVGVGKQGRLVEEDDLRKMVYLDAVVKETLRLHPPEKIVLTHAVTQACSLGGYDVPANAWLNFHLWEMGMDPKVWPNPSEFIPKRHFNEEIDLTGSKQIKMMPFGAGRRICPGLDLAMLHIPLIVARLVQKFVWECKPGESVDLTETHEFSIVMKNSLQAIIKERDSDSE